MGIALGCDEKQSVFNSQADEGEQKSVKQIKEESVQIPNNITGMYLTCTPPSEATATDLKTSINCGIIDSNQQPVPLATAADKWEIKHPPAEPMLVEAIEQPGKNELPILINLTIDPNHTFPASYLNTYAAAFKFGILVTKNGQEKLLIPLEQQIPGNEQPSDLIPGIGLPASDWVAQLLPENGNGLELALSLRDIMNGQKINLTDKNPDFGLVLGDGSTAYGGDRSASNDISGLNVSRRTNLDETHHLVLEISEGESIRQFEEASSTIVEAIISEQSYIKNSAINKIFFIADNKTYWFQSAGKTSYQEAQINCQIMGKTISSIGSPTAQAAVRRLKNLTGGAFWLGQLAPEENTATDPCPRFEDNDLACTAQQYYLCED